ncbi:MAG TPA: GntR family transcriptional regulator [Chloroflexota bacterium]|jgi:DNA-binding GntR family transcriptional regulator|nr:GntR family transcriptional regulator [Chloroflexota bacterium]
MTVGEGTPNTNGRRARTVLAVPVYEALKERIMDRDLEPGARLNIDALAAELDVSPTPVREALARLAAERLVSVEPFKGYSVVSLLTQRRLAQLMHARRLLEGDAARQAALRVIPAQLRAMKQALDGMAALRPGPRFGDFRLYNRHDRVFHETLFAAAENEVVLEVYRTLSPHAQLARLYHDRGEVDYRESIVEHRAIYEALAGRDPEATYRAVIAHVDGVERRLGGHLDRRLAQAASGPGPTASAGGPASSEDAAPAWRPRQPWSSSRGRRSTTAGQG